MSALRGLGYFLIACAIGTVLLLIAFFGAAFGVVLFILFMIYVIGFVAKQSLDDKI